MTTRSKARPKIVSIRRYLGWIMLSALLPMGIFAAGLLYFLWDTQQSHRNDEQIARVQAIGSVIEGEIESTVARLELLASDPLLTDATLRDFHARARGVLAHSDDWATVLLLSPSQQLMNGSVPFGTELPPTTDMAYIRQAFSLAKPAVSDLLLAPVLKAKTVAVAVPVLRDGNVQYVLVAALRLDHISATLAKLAPQGGITSLFDRNDNFIARSRDPDVYLGQLPGLRLLAGMQKQRDGIVRSTTKEGVDTFSAFTQLDNGWKVVVGTPSADSDRALGRSLTVLVVLWLLVLGLGVTLARFLLRRIDRSIAGTVATAEALANGHAVAFPPTAVMELGALSAALHSLFLRERQARDQEQAANRTKDEFLAMLGHELRNPLAPITTALHLMRLRGGDNFAKERGIIERQVQHMVRLIDDLLDVTRITRGTVELRRGPLQMDSVVARAVETASPLFEQRQLRLEVTVPPGLAVNGDAVRLSQVISNLLTNAAKFTPAGGNVAVRGRKYARLVEVTVTDTGIGMDSDELARVFDLFTQGRQSVDRPHGGLGLGLAIARSLTKLHGGELTATSGGRGGGSTFCVTLPLLESPPEEAPAPVPAALPAPRGNARVLVVDDNVDAALVLKDLLEDWGYTTHIAHDGPQALQLLKNAGPFDVGVLDIGLPGMDGYELAEHIRKSPDAARMRLIALTGYGQEADRQKATRVGFDTHLVKPVDVQLLAEALQ